MNEMYAEKTVKKKLSVEMKLLKYAIIFGVLVLFLLSLSVARGTSISYILIVLAILLMFGLFKYIIPRFSAEYEYIYCDGQFDFDTILGGSQRKHLLRIDLEDAECLAAFDTEQALLYSKQDGMTEKDFSSGLPDAEKYIIIGSNEKGKVKVIFEPSSEMLDYAKKKAPRKVFTGYANKGTVA